MISYLARHYHLNTMPEIVIICIYGLHNFVKTRAKKGTQLGSPCCTPNSERRQPMMRTVKPDGASLESVQHSHEEEHL